MAPRSAARRYLLRGSGRGSRVRFLEAVCKHAQLNEIEPLAVYPSLCCRLGLLGAPRAPSPDPDREANPRENEVFFAFN